MGAPAARLLCASLSLFSPFIISHFLLLLFSPRQAYSGVGDDAGSFFMMFELAHLPSSTLPPRDPCDGAETLLRRLFGAEGLGGMPSVITLQAGCAMPQPAPPTLDPPEVPPLAAPPWEGRGDSVG